MRYATVHRWPRARGHVRAGCIADGGACRDAVSGGDHANVVLWPSLAWTVAMGNTAEGHAVVLRIPNASNERERFESSLSEIGRHLCRQSGQQFRTFFLDSGQRCPRMLAMSLFAHVVRTLMD